MLSPRPRLPPRLPRPTPLLLLPSLRPRPPRLRLPSRLCKSEQNMGGHRTDQSRTAAAEPAAPAAEPIVPAAEPAAESSAEAAAKADAEVKDAAPAKADEAPAAEKEAAAKALKAGRRLSARFTGFFKPKEHHHKKESSPPPKDEAPKDEAAAPAAVAEDAPKIESPAPAEPIQIETVSCRRVGFTDSLSPSLPHHPLRLLSLPRPRVTIE